MIYPPAPCHPQFCSSCGGFGEIDGGNCAQCGGTGYLGGKIDCQERLQAAADFSAPGYEAEGAAT